MIRLKAPQDLGAGLLFALIGICGIWFGREHPFGSAVQIGPGYVPIMMSGGLVIIGVVLAAKSIVFAGPGIERGDWRPRLLILASVLAFAGLIEEFGLVVTGAITVIIAGFATREVRRVEIAILAIAFSVSCALLFVYVLKQPLPLWGKN